MWVRRKGLKIYLVDFGSAVLGSGTRTAAGTFGYMAPESFGNTFTPKSDLYLDLYLEVRWNKQNAEIYLLKSSRWKNRMISELCLPFIGCWFVLQGILACMSQNFTFCHEANTTTFRSDIRPRTVWYGQLESAQIMVEISNPDFRLMKDVWILHYLTAQSCTIFQPHELH